MGNRSSTSELQIEQQSTFNIHYNLFKKKKKLGYCLIVWLLFGVHLAIYFFSNFFIKYFLKINKIKKKEKNLFYYFLRKRDCIYKFSVKFCYLSISDIFSDCSSFSSLLLSINRSSFIEKVQRCDDSGGILIVELAYKPVHLINLRKISSK